MERERGGEMGRWRWKEMERDGAGAGGRDEVGREGEKSQAVAKAS